MTAYPCARCGAPYEMEGRRRSLYCVDCRKARTRERAAERNRARTGRRDDVLHVLNEYTKQGMSEDYAAMMHGRVDDYLGDVGRVDDLDGFQDAQPLEGRNSPAGPEVGTSSTSTSLGGLAEQARRDAVAAHPWWAANPNWHVGMDNVDEPIPRTAYLNAC